MSFELKSSGFENNGFIPSQFTAQGADISPALQWHDSPAGRWNPGRESICRRPERRIDTSLSYMLLIVFWKQKAV